MAPKKDKGKGKEIPPKKGLTNVRSWLHATTPKSSNAPLMIKDESVDGPSNVPPMTKDDESSCGSSRPNVLTPEMITPQMVTPELLKALKAALDQSVGNLPPLPSEGLLPHVPKTLKATSKALNTMALTAKPVATNPERLLHQNFQMTEVASSSKKIIVPQKNVPKSKFFIKDNFEHVFPVEKGMFEEDPYEFAKKIFSDKFNFIPHDNFKTIQFYEKILSETNSVSFKHFETNGVINYSTARIHKVINLNEWPGHPLQCQKFKINPMDPSLSYRNAFNYFDYKQAWWNAFYQMNSTRSHTWLIFFDKCSSKNIPIWFAKWWDEFGPIDDIIHTRAYQGYHSFLKMYDPKPYERAFKLSMLYFLHISISWVMAWFFDYIKDTKTNNPILVRWYKVKWWDSFKLWERVEDEAILKWIISSNATSASNAIAVQAPFLHDRGFLITSMAKATTHDEMKELLEQALANLNGSNVQTSTGSTDSGSHHSGNTNEDDCYGIDLADP